MLPRFFGCSDPIQVTVWNSWNVIGLPQMGVQEMGVGGVSGRPSWKSAFSPLSPFSRGSEKYLGNPENVRKRPFSSDIRRFA